MNTYLKQLALISHCKHYNFPTGSTIKSLQDQIDSLQQQLQSAQLAANTAVNSQMNMPPPAAQQQQQRMPMVS